ncbi:hypothetical protein [Psychromonas sp. SP041]|uniref:hypothetical protein n=1 Tax=Psychromonas sp. SP041 TaxID=1365007 RepID=UPI0004158F3F|nr:hypothetical protein [Psychromonas sp. SP041]
MKTEVIRNLYIEQLKGNNVRLERYYEHQLNLCPNINKLGLVDPYVSLRSAYMDYRDNYRNYSTDDFDNLNKEIMGRGIELQKDTVLFHGRGNELGETVRPISSSIHPSIAIWHARKHRNFELAGQPVFIYALNATKESMLKVCVDFSDIKFGHEYEVLLQSGIVIKELNRKQILDGVFLIEANIEIA